MNATILVSLSLVFAQVEPPGPPALPPTNRAVLQAPVPKEQPTPPPAAKGEKETPADNGQTTGGFPRRFIKAYLDEFHPKEDDANAEAPPRRAMPSPFESPPLPTAEYQGFPLIGVPPDTTKYPLMKALDGTQAGQFLDDNRLRVYGWANASANWTNNRVTNTPTSYWVAPNSIQLDQAAIRIERQVNTVQTDHIDVGFRATVDYGIDYRYFTAGGWFSRQLLVNNNLYGWDPTELFANIYVPGVGRGMVVTIGRWIACPDIETQFAPDNLMGSHSLQFTVDVYTQTGIMASVMLNEQWMVQACINAGADMAPWYKGANPNGMFGVRWVSKDNMDSFYTVLNEIGNDRYQYFTQDGIPAGHHNYNILQSTWQHKFNDKLFTKTEGYIMWERDAPVGGTPSIGPVQFGSGGGLGPTIPGTSLTYGILNYTVLQVSKKDFFVLRNEWMNDEHGTRYGYAGNYSSHSVGWTHNFTPSFQVRPEFGYYRNWNTLTFDNGQRKDMFMAAVDFTIRF